MYLLGLFWKRRLVSIVGIPYSWCKQKWINSKKICSSKLIESMHANRNCLFLCRPDRCIINSLFLLVRDQHHCDWSKMWRWWNFSRNQCMIVSDKANDGSKLLIECANDQDKSSQCLTLLHHRSKAERQHQHRTLSNWSTYCCFRDKTTRNRWFANRYNMNEVKLHLKWGRQRKEGSNWTITIRRQTNCGRIEPDVKKTRFHVDNERVECISIKTITNSTSAISSTNVNQETSQDDRPQRKMSQ